MTKAVPSTQTMTTTNVDSSPSPARKSKEPPAEQTTTVTNVEAPQSSTEKGEETTVFGDIPTITAACEIRSWYTERWAASRTFRHLKVTPFSPSFAYHELTSFGAFESVKEPPKVSIKCSIISLLRIPFDLESSIKLL